MAKCSFCGNNLEPGKGKIFVKKDGKILYFDKMKCEKNLLKLKRTPRNFKWTKAYIKQK